MLELACIIYRNTFFLSLILSLVPLYYIFTLFLTLSIPVQCRNQVNTHTQSNNNKKSQYCNNNKKGVFFCLASFFSFVQFVCLLISTRIQNKFKFFSKIATFVVVKIYFNEKQSLRVCVCVFVGVSERERGRK